jgi:hypothetical protein
MNEVTQVEAARDHARRRRRRSRSKVIQSTSDE